MARAVVGEHEGFAERFRGARRSTCRLIGTRRATVGKPDGFHGGSVFS